MEKVGLVELPLEIKARLEAFRERLLARLGDNLVAILAHGSVVRGGFRPHDSDIDLVIVVKDDRKELLDAMGNEIALARYSARIEAMILKADEIQGAADVFPLFYDGIRRQHVVLYGSDPFSSLEIHDKHRRLRIEQELREAQIRLRRAVAETLSSESALAGVVLRKVKQVRGPLHSWLLLQKHHLDDERSATVYKLVGSLVDVDVRPLLDVQKSPSEAFSALQTLLTKVITRVDAMQD